MKRLFVTMTAGAFVTGAAFAAGGTDQTAAVGQAGVTAGQQAIGQQMQASAGPVSGEALDSESLTQLQQALAQVGYYDGPIDGIWGPQTEEAVRQFQQVQGFQPTGMLDQPTLTAMGLGNLETGMGEDVASIELDENSVVRIQQSLAESGYYDGPIDGIWGPQTEQALSEFRERQGFQGESMLDPATLAALGLEDLQPTIGQTGQIASPGGIEQQLGTPDQPLPAAPAQAQVGDQPGAATDADVGETEGVTTTQ